MKPIIKVENLSKQYRLGATQTPYGTLRDALAQMARAPINLIRRGREGKRQGEILWALRDINFDVQQGEVVGIIGRNGAGKSTLLKVLSRITEPTTGGVDLYGRVGSLLEVGTGFHPELTGRENIFLNGAILGMQRTEIKKKFDEIVAFAEVEKFIDTPVKFYSSGMYTRLAFSVAAHLEPEILVVDEVLAVGDITFQKKCLGKMGEVAQAGRTVLFVSHNMVAVQGLCSRALWIDKGQVVGEGTAAKIVSDYLKTSFSVMTERVWDEIESAPGNEMVRIRAARVRPVDGTASDPVTIRTPFVLELEYWNLVPDAVLNATVILYNEEGTAVFASGSTSEEEWNERAFPTGLFRSRCYVPGDLLNDGAHRVEVLLVKNQSVAIYRDEEILFFDVRDAMETRRTAWYGNIPGAVRPDLKWSTEQLR